MTGNDTLRCQQTIANPVRLDGFGYWNGLDVLLEFKPAPANSGIVIIRPDLPDCPRMVAHVSHRVDMSLRTVLDNGTIRVEMIEHLMAAFAGLQIDNCEVWIDRAEMPGLDGSSKMFVEVLQSAGIKKQIAEREKLIVSRTMKVGDENSWIQAEPSDGEFSLDYELDFPDCPAIGNQKLQIELNRDSFCNGLANARTFILESQAKLLREKGLCERVTYGDVLVFGDQGVIDNDLRYPDECVRHKSLDFVGDFALAPFDIVGKFTSYRSGHQLHAEMLKRLLQEGHFVSANRSVA